MLDLGEGIQNELVVAFLVVVGQVHRDVVLIVIGLLFFSWLFVFGEALDEVGEKVMLQDI